MLTFRFVKTHTVSLPGTVSLTGYLVQEYF